MCYNAIQLKIRIIREGLEQDNDVETEIMLLRELERLQRELGKEALYNADGLLHPELMVITSLDQNIEVEYMEWGLIPHWTQDDDKAKSIQNYTINARGETMFEKPSFRSSATSKRCVVPLDGFFEHHHFNKQTYPFQIRRKDKKHLYVAGLYDEWVNQGTGEMKRTFTIVTCKANELLTRIHNNPKAKEPRIPVILDIGDIGVWIHSPDKKDIEQLIVPIDDDLLEAFSAPRLRGKLGVGNSENAIKKVEYPELQMIGF